MKVLVLAGGDSNEREVSLASGRAICAALQRLGHDVLAIDPANGRSLLGADGAYLPAVDTTGGPPSALTTAGPQVLASALSTAGGKNVDVVFVGLHGGAGENGSIQNLLSLAGLKFTGSNMTASAAAMDKGMSKNLFRAIDIPTPDWKLYRGRDGQSLDEIASDIVRSFNFPVIVKPNDGGSSIGLTKVEDETGLPDALKMSRAESPDILVEEYLRGREVTVSVLNGEPLPVVEIRPKEGLYDYAAKYTKGKSEYIVPAPIDKSVAEQLQDAAVRAYNIIGASGLARIDYILVGDRDFYLLELNCVPGMTELSLAPMAAASAGINFDQLVERILDGAMKGSRP